MEWLKSQADLEGPEGVKDMVSECGKACSVTELEAHVELDYNETALC